MVETRLASCSCFANCWVESSRKIGYTAKKSCRVTLLISSKYDGADDVFTAMNYVRCIARRSTVTAYGHRQIRGTPTSISVSKSHSFLFDLNNRWLVASLYLNATHLPTDPLLTTSAIDNIIVLGYPHFYLIHSECILYSVITTMLLFCM